MADDARVVALRWHRQAGKDFTAACKAVDNAIKTGSDWYITSLTQRQADASHGKCRLVADVWRRMLQIKASATADEREYVEVDRWIKEKFRCTARTLHLPGGGSVTSLPGRDPDTLAGLTGNLILTEFGLFPGGGYEHWRTVWPLTTRGYCCWVISTPRGKNTKYYEICSDTDTYSVHTQTILDSVAEGLVLRDNNGKPTDLATFERLYGDPIGWQREYLCEFTGSLEALINWAKLERASRGEPCERLHVERGAGWSPGFFRRLAEIESTGRLELGWDVARKGHLSSLWVNAARDGSSERRLAALVTMHDCPFDLMRTIVSEAMETSVRTVGCGDSTGLGADSNETLATKYGDRWQPVVFTGKSRRELASGLVTAFDDGDQVLPPMAGDGASLYKPIHADLYALECDRTGPNLVIDEGANPLLPDSHCDIAWSAALAIRARALNPNTFSLTVV